MSLAVEKSTMCFSYVYIETIVVYKVCRRPVKQFRVITSTCAPIRSCRLCKNKKKKREEEEKRNYMPCKDILEPWPNIGWFIRRLLSRRRRTRSQGDCWMHYYPKMSRKDTSQTSSGSLAQRCFEVQRGQHVIDWFRGEARSKIWLLTR